MAEETATSTSTLDAAAEPSDKSTATSTSTLDAAAESSDKSRATSTSTLDAAAESSDKSRATSTSTLDAAAEASDKSLDNGDQTNEADGECKKMEIENGDKQLEVKKKGQSTEAEKTEVNGSSKDNEEKKETAGSSSKSTGLSEKELHEKICDQVEYYFGDYNLPRDKFLIEQIKVNEGWISMEVMLKCNRLSELSTECETIFAALRSSRLIEVDDTNKRIRRNPALTLPSYNDDIKAETVKRTIYCKGFPRDGTITLDLLLDFFKTYGPYETVYMRHFFDKVTKKSGFKGSVLVVFPTVEKAEEFMKIDDVQYRKMPLLRKWHANYLESKKLEFEERKARKEARQKRVIEEHAKATEAVDPLPKGTFLHLAGFKTNTTREDIKKALLDIIDDVAYVDFCKGNTEGYIRVATPNSNKQVFEALRGKLKVHDTEITVRLVEGDEEDKQIEKAQKAKAKVYVHSASKRKFKGGRGGWGGRPKKRKV